MPFGGSARGGAELTAPHLNFVQVDRVANADANVATTGACQLEDQAWREAVQTSSRITAGKQPLLDARAWAQHFTKPLGDRRGRSFFAQISVGRAAELAHALQQ